MIVQPHFYPMERRGFLTREAAELSIMKRSSTPPYSSTHPAYKGCIFITDPISGAGGRVHTYSYKSRSKGGDVREYFASYIGA